MKNRYIHIAAALITAICLSACGSAQPAAKADTAEAAAPAEDAAASDEGTETEAVEAVAAEASETETADAAAEAEAAEAVVEGSEAAEADNAAAEEEAAAAAAESEATEATANVPKSEQYGTAGSNIPLKDNLKEAEYQIKVALQYKFEEIYGDQVNDARIYVDKMYSYEDEQALEPVREMNLGMNEVAFEVHYELHPSEGADINLLLIPNGEYDEESGWIKDVFRLGVLRKNEDTTSEQKYVITDFGTGW
ncbi:MAG: hypothetical protein IJ061_09450 [Lachnospiraceae bacterium]|nr:hypothetical protein [Lachnospiraceae bacterium]